MHELNICIIILSIFKSGVIMIIHIDVHSEIKINRLEDLHKLKPIMEENNLKVNKAR